MMHNPAIRLITTVTIAAAPPATAYEVVDTVPYVPAPSGERTAMFDMPRTSMISTTITSATTDSARPQPPEGARNCVAVPS